MKKYAVFIGQVYYPSSGFQDLVLDTDDMDEAIEKAKSIGDDKYAWAKVYDTHEMEEILDI